MKSNMHEQFMLTNDVRETFAPDLGFVSSQNVLQTSKSIVIGSSYAKTIVDPNKGITTGTPISLGLDVMTYASTITVDVTKPAFHTTTTTSTVGDTTINASSPGLTGQLIIFKVANDANADKTITFGTNFKPNGTLVGSTSLSAVITFVSDSTNWWEVSRTTKL